MSIRVIGAGMGRTGTLSLRYALEQLNHGPCYHMVEVLRMPQHVSLWIAAADGGGAATNWGAIFKGYSSTVDWPSTRFIHELAAYYPQAKVILTEREPEKWYESVYETIYKFSMRDLSTADDAALQFNKMAVKVIFEQTFHGKFDDPTYAMDVYVQHNEWVKRSIAPERLLSFSVAEGWGPLCAFLSCGVPDVPFPKMNTKDEFIQRGKELQQPQR